MGGTAGSVNFSSQGMRSFCLQGNSCILEEPGFANQGGTAGRLYLSSLYKG